MLTHIEKIIDVDFIDAQGIDAGNVRFGFYNDSRFDGVAVPGADGDTGYALIGGSQATLGAIGASANYLRYLLLHEVSHVLGLGHADSGELWSDYTALGVTAEETVQYTIMSYRPHPEYEGSSSADTIWPRTLMLYDIAALQQLYGKNTSSDGVTTYQWQANEVFIETVWDGSSDIDTFDASNQPQRVVLDLRQGEFSSVGAVPNGAPGIDNLAVAYGTVIENAKGGDEADLLIGNVQHNVLDGADSEDWILGDGIDLDEASNLDAGYILSDLAPKESREGYFEPQSRPPADDPLDDSLNGGSGNDWMWGGPGNDWLDGDRDNDVLFGDSDAVASYPGGGTDNANDTISGGEGFDWAAGGPGADSLSGGDDDDFLYGESDSPNEFTGDDRIDGGKGSDYLDGGAGRDALLGGAGNDGLHSDGDADVDLLYGGSGADEFHVGDRDIIIAPDSDDRIYYNGKLLDGRLFAEPQDGGGFAGYFIGSEGEIYISPDSTGLFNLLIILPNFDGVVAVLEWYEGSADAGVVFDHEHSVVVSDPYEIDASLTAQLIYDELGPLVSAWGWDAEAGGFGPNGPNPAPSPDLWIDSDLPFDLTDGVEEFGLLATGKSLPSGTVLAMSDLLSDDESGTVVSQSSVAKGPLCPCGSGAGRAAIVSDIALPSVGIATPEEAAAMAA